MHKHFLIVSIMLLITAMNYTAENSSRALQQLTALECSSLVSLIAIDELDLAIKKVDDMRQRGIRLDAHKYDGIKKIITGKRDEWKKAGLCSVVALVSWVQAYANYSEYYSLAQKCSGTKVVDQAIFANTIDASIWTYYGYSHGSAWLENRTKFPLLEAALTAIKR
ncbi:MAG: hypothetical protein WCE21_00080 [Candidatus Babeliales bacterium]